MPEEHNRVLTDHASDLLLAPTRVAMDHLTNEGIGERSVLVGDVMTDVCFRVRDFLDTRSFALPAGFAAGKYVVATIHRAENTDDPGRLAAIIDSLDELPIPVLLLAHPRLVARCRKFGIDLERSRGAVRTAQPLPYPGMVAAIMNSAGVVTDSGGLQKEAFLLQRICTTLRSETEWVETLEDGWNALVPDLNGLDKHVLRPIPDAPQASPFGDGRAADHVLVALENWSD
jgi:UDP-N-acetylglucosamine 2-epimerase (non-hydrolysing)